MQYYDYDIILLNEPFTGSNNSGNLIYLGTDFLRIFVKGNFDLFKMLEKQIPEKDFSPYYKIGVTRRVLMSSYISISCSQTYVKDLDYLGKIARETKSLKLKILSLFFKFPRKVHQAIIFITYTCIFGSQKYQKIMSFYEGRHLDGGKRRVTSDENFHDNAK